MHVRLAVMITLYHMYSRSSLYMHVCVVVWNPGTPSWLATMYHVIGSAVKFEHTLTCPPNRKYAQPRNTGCGLPLVVMGICHVLATQYAL